MRLFKFWLLRNNTLQGANLKIITVDFDNSNVEQLVTSTTKISLSGLKRFKLKKLISKKKNILFVQILSVKMFPMAYP